MDTKKSLLIIIVLVALSGLVWIFREANQEPPFFTCPVVETQICADGSIVDRVPPFCDFAKCPITVLPTTTDTDGWRVYHNNQYGFEFKYPSNLGPLTSLADGAIALEADGSAVMILNRPKVFKDPLTRKPQSFNDFMSQDQGKYTKSSIVVGGIPSVTFSSPQTGDETFVPLPNNQILVISGSVSNPTLQKVFSTFRFLK